jgi:hypothetical protein
VARLAEPGVREHLEHPGEGLAHALAPGVARAPGVRARGALEDAVVGHEGHQEIDVVTVPAVGEERFQVVGGHHGRDPRAVAPRQFPIHLVARAAAPHVWRLR